ncbi:putative damage-inducible protein DinB [Streptomyces sp. B4I13]|uniref:DinB family protein n=1 Tax=Streptomyces sp. B4I13 TaxID=3042271 RepID=UPI00278224BF|nr:DinB family protein [Streptomyces sp. B4I13]MDQ0962745.1 putative damage-inducible protein DinB [Streptomyces sp. B4I13]
MTTDAHRKLPDGRPVPLLTGEELPMLESWLAFHRATLELKCAGLDDGQARTTSAEPSSLTLLGLVQHLAEVERNWFQRAFAGHEVPPVFGERTGYALDADRGLDEALTVWRREIARGRELIAGRSLEDTGRIVDGPMAGLEVSLRWVLVHMIEEYARHNGHADILRERLDGVTGT